MSINNRHRTFARELVALARKHNMDGITFSFFEKFHSMGDLPKDYTTGTIKGSWHSGRHGALNQIDLRAESQETIKETAES